MKRLYWRPAGASRVILILLALLCVGGLVIVEVFKTQARQPHLPEKLAAARLAAKGMKTLKAERLARSGHIDVSSDPAHSGLIGPAMTKITTATGSLESKQTTMNPNFAAVLVHMLKRLDVETGDQIAAGCSGSFPALNLALYAAAEVLKLRAVVIASAAASQFGANDPNFTWLDMEHVLAKRRIFSTRSVAATVGGIEDMALGVPDEGRQALVAAIERNGVRFLQPTSFNDSIQQRMAIYAEHSEGRGYGAYVNIGGGAISVGRRAGSRRFQPGINRRAPLGSYSIDSIMMRFLNEGTPVIHLSRITHLADQYALPVAPKVIPRPGKGGVFYRVDYNPWLVVGVLLLILACLFALVRSDLGFRLLSATTSRRVQKHPEPMV